jgi:hypothetical protein
MRSTFIGAFSKTLSQLAMNPGRIKERLIVAAVEGVGNIPPAEIETMPSHLRDDFKQFYAELTDKGRDSIPNTINRMSEDQAQVLVYDFLGCIRTCTHSETIF